MKVFSLNKKSALDFWGAFTPRMIERFCKPGSQEAEWLSVACEAMLGNRGSSYLEAEYDWFISPEASEEDKMNLLGGFFGGCKRNASNTQKKELGIVDMTAEDPDTTNLSGCISDTDKALQTCAEDLYDPILSECTFKKIVEQLEDAREYVISEEGVDIFTLIKYLANVRLGVGRIGQEALTRVRQVIAEYNMTDLIKSALELDGMVDYISRRVEDM